MPKQQAIRLVCCCLTFLPVFAQQTAPSHLITLNVVAANKSGQSITGLSEQDFTLLDNKQPTKIVSFQAASGATTQPPAKVIFVVDEVNASFMTVAREREQIVNFLQKDGGKLPLPTSLIFFSDKGATVPSTPSLDSNALIALLKENQNAQHTITRSQGFYGASDRMQLSLRTLEQIAEYEEAQPGRKLLLWISPGWPLLTGPRIELSNKDQQQVFNTIVALYANLRAAQITLYSVDPLGTADAVSLRTSYYETFLKGIKRPSQVQFGNLALQVLAYQSGGKVLNSNNDLAALIATCLADANSFYIVSFEAALADGPNDYHSLEIKIDKPGVTARTRTGYYAQPEPPNAH